ncbi:MAG: hypothetical protein KU38_11220 [Sulfurovum sp. FS08-3]|nr:MAG: hypothetical protein KU38_11220 [Sulfurovum sp. FS08-3]
MANSLDKLQPIQKLGVWLHLTDACNLRCGCCYFCTAGCPIETYQATGHYNRKSPNCAIYKAIFDELLKLEALRLMQL